VAPLLGMNEHTIPTIYTMTELPVTHTVYIIVMAAKNVQYSLVLYCLDSELFHQYTSASMSACGLCCMCLVGMGILEVLQQRCKCAHYKPAKHTTTVYNTRK